MGALKDLAEVAAKQGAYMRGYNDAIEGRQRKTWKLSNKEEYDKGYDDGLQQSLIKATEEKN